MPPVVLIWHDARMLGMRDLPAVDLHGTCPPAAAALIARLQEREQAQEQQLASVSRSLRDDELAHRQDLLQRKDRELALREAKIEKITFELARLKRWKFGAKSEAMNAEQRRLFEETLTEDEASLREQLERLRREAARCRREHQAQGAPAPAEASTTACASAPRRAPPRAREHRLRRARLRPGDDAHRRRHQRAAGHRAGRVLRAPAHLRQVGLPLLPDPEAGTGRAGVDRRRHRRQRLVAHTLISRFVDHLPYYRQETINARSDVHTPRSTLASIAGQAGAALEPLFEVHKRFVLGCRVLHADETPVALLDPGAGKTRRAYIWAYARSLHDAVPGVVYDFCLGRGAQYPVAFLAGDEQRGHRRWSGTLLTDRYSAYDTVLDPRIHPDRIDAACAAHARRKYEELARDGTSPLAEDAIRRFARIYAVEGELTGLSDEQRQALRQQLARPLWEQLKTWLELERRLVADGGATAGAIDYTLNHWRRSHGTWTTARWPSTTTTWSGRSSPGPWGARPGCSSAASSPASVRRW
jgi:transposase